MISEPGTTCVGRLGAAIAEADLRSARRCGSCVQDRRSRVADARATARAGGRRGAHRPEPDLNHEAGARLAGGAIALGSWPRRRGRRGPPGRLASRRQPAPACCLSSSAAAGRAARCTGSRGQALLALCATCCRRQWGARDPLRGGGRCSPNLGPVVPSGYLWKVTASNQRVVRLGPRFPRRRPALRGARYQVSCSSTVGWRARRARTLPGRRCTPSISATSTRRCASPPRGGADLKPSQGRLLRAGWRWRADLGHPERLVQQARAKPAGQPDGRRRQRVQHLGPSQGPSEPSEGSVDTVLHELVQRPGHGRGRRAKAADLELAITGRPDLRRPRIRPVELASHPGDIPWSLSRHYNAGRRAARLAALAPYSGVPVPAPEQRHDRRHEQREDHGRVEQVRPRADLRGPRRRVSGPLDSSTKMQNRISAPSSPASRVRYGDRRLVGRASAGRALASS